MGIAHDPTSWRLFIDSSATSLKAVLLHNGNEFPSIPVGHSTQLKETYDNVKKLLDAIDYKTYNWYVCGDFKKLDFYWVYKGDLLNIHAFCVCGIVGPQIITIKEQNGQNLRNYCQVSQMFYDSHWLTEIRYCCHHFI
jgi:hypothetical protein